MSVHWGGGTPSQGRPPPRGPGLTNPSGTHGPGLFRPLGFGCTDVGFLGAGIILAVQRPPYTSQVFELRQSTSVFISPC